MNFNANPTTITAGQSSTLTWNVEGSESVEISGVGTVAASGTRQVSPTETTTYTLTARNRFGQVTSTSTVTVNARPVDPTPAPTLTACVANPTGPISAGSSVQISYVAANAQSVVFSPAVSGATVSGPVTVMPNATTTYTITATGTDNRTATCAVTITVNTTEPPDVIIRGGPVIETTQRLLVLDASVRTDPAGGALTYEWGTDIRTATIIDQGQATTRVYLAGLADEYNFRVTVRNAQGQSGTATITVRLKNPENI